MTAPHLVLGVLDGDDIGHEIVPASVRLASVAAERHGLRIAWQPMPVGRRALDTHGATLPPGTLETLAQMDGFVLGPIGHRDYPRVPGAINPHPIMRKHFNLFANVRPTRSYPDIGCLRGPTPSRWMRSSTNGGRRTRCGLPISRFPSSSSWARASTRWRFRGTSRKGISGLPCATTRIRRRPIAAFPTSSPSGS